MLLYNSMSIKRYILGELTAHLPRKEFSLIVGPRQAGEYLLYFS